MRGKKGFSGQIKPPKWETLGLAGFQKGSLILESGKVSRGEQYVGGSQLLGSQGQICLHQHLQRVEISCQLTSTTVSQLTPFLMTLYNI